MKVIKTKTKSFYSKMVAWCEGHNFPIISPSMLPEYTFVCYNDKGEEAYSLCFYNTDSNLCWVGWELSNPNLSKEDKKGCLKYLFLVVEQYAKKAGYQLIFTTSNTKPVEDILKQVEYSVGDTNVNHYIKLI